MICRPSASTRCAASRSSTTAPETGEFFHAYTRTFDGRFFFEIVQRRNYDGFGAVNASVRLAAQAMQEKAGR